MSRGAALPPIVIQLSPYYKKNSPVSGNSRQGMRGAEFFQQDGKSDSAYQSIEKSPVICYTFYVAPSKPQRGGGVSDGGFVQFFHLRYGRCRQLLHLQMAERQMMSNQPKEPLIK